MSRSDFRLSYEICPIILVGGIAQDLPEQMMPIIALTEQGNFDDGLVSGSVALNNDEYFATFKVLPGSKLVSNDIGSYPFANQAVAANALIGKPVPISILMICPAKFPGDYMVKAQIMTALRQSLNQHNSAGGTYTIATPAYTFDNVVMLDFVDVTSGESKQVQYEWRLDFIKPLLTEEDAQEAYNSLMTKINGGLPATPDDDGYVQWSGEQLTSDIQTGTTNSTTGAKNLQGSSVSPAGLQSGTTQTLMG